MILNPIPPKSTLTPLLEIFHSPFSNISPNSHRTIHPPRNSNEYKLLLFPEFLETKTLVLSRLIKDTKTIPHSPHKYHLPQPPSLSPPTNQRKPTNKARKETVTNLPKKIQYLYSTTPTHPLPNQTKQPKNKKMSLFANPTLPQVIILVLSIVAIITVIAVLFGMWWRRYTVEGRKDAAGDVYG